LLFLGLFCLVLGLGHELCVIVANPTFYDAVSAAIAAVNVPGKI